MRATDRAKAAEQGRAFVTVKMDRELLARIDAEVERRMISRTFLFERVLGDWLTEHEEDGVA